MGTRTPLSLQYSRPLCGASVALNSVIFVSKISITSGVIKSYGLSRRFEAVKNCRSVKEKHEMGRCYEGTVKTHGVLAVIAAARTLPLTSQESKRCDCGILFVCFVCVTSINIGCDFPRFFFPRCFFPSFDLRKVQTLGPNGAEPLYRRHPPNTPPWCMYCFRVPCSTRRFTHYLPDSQ